MAFILFLVVKKYINNKVIPILCLVKNIILIITPIKISLYLLLLSIRININNNKKLQKILYLDNGINTKRINK